MTDDKLSLDRVDLIALIFVFHLAREFIDAVVQAMGY